MTEMKHVDPAQYRKMMLKKRLILVAIILVFAAAIACAVKFYLLPTIAKKKAAQTTTAPTTVTTTEATTEPESYEMDFTFEIPEKYDHDYAVAVNRQKSVVTIFEKDEEGNFTVPVKAMLCACGRDEYKTNEGTFEAGTKIKVMSRKGGRYSKYCTRISKEYGLYFMSVSYTSKTDDSLVYEDYNKLGTNYTTGAVELCMADAIWIYENIDAGTIIYVYDSEIPSVLGMPTATRIDPTSEYKGWDPTDPSENNPWKNA